MGCLSENLFRKLFSCNKKKQPQTGKMKCNMAVKEEQYSCCLGCCVEDSANVILVTAASTLNPTDW